MRWKSNARKNKNLKSGTIFNINYENTRITIHKIFHCGETFYLTCSELNLSSYDLGTTDFDTAVLVSKSVIKRRIDNIVAKYEKFLNDDSENEIV